MRAHTGTPVPLLILGDSPTLATGLGRIGRELALLIAHHLPDFRVGYFGRGGQIDRRMPFPQYNFQPSSYSEWGEFELPAVWGNFAGAEHGIILTIWDPSRLTWFPAMPAESGEGEAFAHSKEYARLQRFLSSDRFERWGYFPIDALGAGANGALTGQLAQTLAGFDRVLAYTQFGADVIHASLRSVLGLPSGGNVYPVVASPEFIPHGYDPAIFRPAKDDEEIRRAKQALGFQPEHTVIGCVMSNQARKDWGVWAQTAARLSMQEHRKSLRFWAHTDSIDRYWDIRVLLEDHRLWDLVKLTLDEVPDSTMAERYRACDVTMLPSLGEGFGYPIVESMACGIPCVHVQYAGGAGLGLLHVKPVSYRADGRWNLVRPVLAYEDFTAAVQQALRLRDANGIEAMTAECVKHVEHLQWKQLWHGAWRPWLLEGIGAWEGERLASDMRERQGKFYRPEGAPINAKGEPSNER